MARGIKVAISRTEVSVGPSGLGEPATSRIRCRPSFKRSDGDVGLSGHPQSSQVLDTSDEAT